MVRRVLRSTSETPSIGLSSRERVHPSTVQTYMYNLSVLLFLYIYQYIRLTCFHAKEPACCCNNIFFRSERILKDFLKCIILHNRTEISESHVLKMSIPSFPYYLKVVHLSSAPIKSNLPRLLLFSSLTLLLCSLPSSVQRLKRLNGYLESLYTFSASFQLGPILHDYTLFCGGVFTPLPNLEYIFTKSITHFCKWKGTTNFLEFMPYTSLTPPLPAWSLQFASNTI